MESQAVRVDRRTLRSDGTRARLLDAAREEFQEKGLSGGRVDAIAEAAGANKRMIYAYFGSKSALFDTVLADNVARVAAAVPFTPADLPDYAVRLFDYWTSDATSLRLFSWRNIELTSVPGFENDTYAEMIVALEKVSVEQATGIPAPHLLAFVFALVLAWVIPAEVFQHPDVDETALRRRSLATAIRNMLAG